MPDRRSNPFGTNVLPHLRLGSTEHDEKFELSRIVQDGLDWDHSRMGWVSRQQAMTKLRRGIKEPKSFPWPNAANLTVPLIDNAIRKYKPLLVRLAFDPDPVVEFVGEDPDAVDSERKAEQVFNWLWKTEMDALEPMSYMIDGLCHRGFYFLEVGWDWQEEYETRVVSSESVKRAGPRSADEIMQWLAVQYRLYLDDPVIVKSLMSAATDIEAGKEFTKISFKRTIKDRPALWERDPIQVIAPPRTTDVPNAERIIVQHAVSARWIKRKEADGYFRPGSVKKILTDVKRSSMQAGRSNEMDTAMASSTAREKALQDEAERIWGAEDEENILLWRVYHWHDYNKDGLDERVDSWMHPRSATSLGTHAFACPFHEWPIEKLDFEKTNRRWHSPRGITEMLKDMQVEISAQHNARLDAMALRNAPVYQVPVLAGFVDRNMRAMPGTILHVPGQARIEPLAQDRGAFGESVNEESLLRSIAEQYVGIFDASITSPQSATRARTATEIQAIVQYTSATATLDAMLFQMQMRDVYMKVWQLFMEIGPEEIKIKVAGDGKRSTEDKLVTIPKGEINKKYKMVPTGSIANTNRALEISNAREAMTFFLNDQTEIINHYELRKWYLSLLTPRWSRRILNPQQEAAALQVLKQAASVVQGREGNDILAAMGGNGSVPEPVEGPRQEIAAGGQYGGTNGL